MVYTTPGDGQADMMAQLSRIAKLTLNLPFIVTDDQRQCIGIYLLAIPWTWKVLE